MCCSLVEAWDEFGSFGLDILDDCACKQDYAVYSQSPASVCGPGLLWAPSNTQFANLHFWEFRCSNVLHNAAPKIGDDDRRSEIVILAISEVLVPVRDDRNRTEDQAEEAPEEVWA